MICHQEVTFFGWFDTIFSFKDLELEYFTRGHLRSINQQQGSSFMLDGQDAHLYTIVSSLHDRPSKQLSCVYKVSCSRCSPLKGGSFLQNPLNSCDVRFKLLIYKYINLRIVLDWYHDFDEFSNYYHSNYSPSKGRLYK